MTQQGERHQSFRDISGTAGTYNSDLYSMCLTAVADQGSLNGTLLAFLQNNLSSSSTNLPDLMNQFAISQGFNSWSDLGAFATLASEANINLLLCGDSITAANMSQSSTTHHAEGNGVLTQLNAMIGHRLKLINDFDAGVGGETAQTRTSSLSDYDTIISRYPATWVAAECYGRNDISAGRTAAQVYADRVTIIDHLLTIVDYVFVESIKPSDYASNTVAYNLRAEEVNSDLQTYCSTNPRLIYVDTYSVMGDSSGLNANYTIDAGIHLNAYGCNVAAKAYMPLMAGLTGVGSDNSTNTFITNPTLTGTGGTVGGGVSGTIADSWTSAYSGGTTDIARVFSKNADGSQNVTVTAGTGAGADEVTYFMQEIVMSASDVGKVIRPKMKIRVNEMTRGYWCGLQCIQLNSGGSSIYTSTDLDKRTAVIADAFDTTDGTTFWLQAPDALIVDGCDKIRLRVAIGLIADGSAASANVDVFYGALEEVTNSSYAPEFIGSKLAFWLDTSQPALFTVDGSNKCSVIADAGWSGNTAVPFTNFEDEFDYVESDATVGGQALRNVGASVIDTSAGYRFTNGLSALTEPRAFVVVFRGDVNTADAGGSSSNGVFGDGKYTSGTTAVLGVRQLRDTHEQLQLMGLGYASGFADTTDEFKAYWGQYDGTDIYGGYDLTTSEGPATASLTGRVEDGFGYIGCDYGSVSAVAIGWFKQAMYFNDNPTVGEMQYAIRILAHKGGASL